MSKATKPVISLVTPDANFIGGQVVIEGRGFSVDASQNVVEFSGIAAVIYEATEVRLIVEVPNGAITGPIFLSTPGGATHSNVVFTILRPT